MEIEHEWLEIFPLHQRQEALEPRILPPSSIDDVAVDIVVIGAAARRKPVVLFFRFQNERRHQVDIDAPAPSAAMAPTAANVVSRFAAALPSVTAPDRTEGMRHEYRNWKILQRPMG
jgi:hypothetical protein